MERNCASLQVFSAPVHKIFLFPILVSTLCVILLQCSFMFVYFAFPILVSTLCVILLQCSFMFVYFAFPILVSTLCVILLQYSFMFVYFACVIKTLKFACVQNGRQTYT